MRVLALVLLRVSIAILLYSCLVRGETRLIRFQQPPTLSFQDLVTLASVDPPPPELQQRLTALFAKPFISNEAALDGAQPRRPAGHGTGVLRVAEWNINRLDKPSLTLALADLAAYQAAAQANPKLSPKALQKALDEVRFLQGADVIVLDEIDDGVKRSGYYDVPRDLSRLLHMNYAFGVEFVELNPLYLAARKMDIVDLPRQRRDAETYGVDPNRYLGLEGTAILARYPILSVKIVPLPQEYDWYRDEIGAISNLVKIEKWSAEKLFGERLARQVRRGGRMALIVELAVPGMPTGVLTLVCPHLEDYTGPQGRRTQMNFLLGQVRGISGPVLSAGDLNTLGRDGAPVTPRRAVKSYLLDYKFWLRETAYLLAPIPGLSFAISGLNFLKNYHDPTARNIPVFASNPAEALFADIHRFRFADGGAFDWAGSKRRGFLHKGHTLSDSNQRAAKGFSPTFSFHRTFHGIVGEYKIDWMFMKHLDESPLPYRGRTLCELNTGLGRRISDHCPVTIDLLLPQ